MNKIKSLLKRATYIVAFFILSTTGALYCEETQGATVDFAFPQTVERDAVSHLEESLKAGDDVGALKYVIQIIVARNEISSGNFNKNILLIDSVADCLKSPYNSLCYLLEAKLYQQLYNQNRWQYDKRTLPLDSYPSDPLSWSGELFAQKTLELIGKARQENGMAEKVPISAVSSVLTDCNVAEKAKFSVYDFILINSVDLLSGFSNTGGSIIPFRKDGGETAMTPSEKCSKEALRLLEDFYARSAEENNPASEAIAIKLKSDRMAGEEKIEFLYRCMERMKNCPEGGAVMNAYFDATAGSGNITEEGLKALYAIMKEWKRNFPDSEYAKAVEYDLAKMRASKAYLDLPASSLPHRAVKGSISLTNMKVGYILLYKVPESIVPMNSLNVKEFPAQGKFVTAVKVSAEGEVPFKADISFELPPLPPGYYVAVPSAGPTLSKSWRSQVERWSMNVISVSGIAMVSSNNNGQPGAGVVYVVDAETQRPVAGAEIKCYDNGNAQKLIHSGVTDENGAYEMPNGFYRVRASYQGSTVWNWEDLQYYKTNESKSVRANILTDLSVYKPGDEVKFGLVGWTSNEKELSLIKGKDAKIELRDANWNSIDSLILKTDDFGRTSGSFQIPRSGLLGSYGLVVTFPEVGPGSAIQSFQVAEYKSPGFFVKVETASQESYMAGDEVRFTGEVMTYSGMPLGNAEVTYDIEWHPWWRWWGGAGGEAHYGGSLTAESDGKFMISLPTENLKGTRFEKGIFTLKVTATSSSGETQTSGDLRFSLGNGLSVRPSIPETLEVTGDSLQFTVGVYDMLDHPTVKPVDYQVENMTTGQVISSGVFSSPRLDLGADLFPSGKYRFIFSLPNDTLKTDSEVVIWRKEDICPPYDTQLWVPDKEIIVPEGEASVPVSIGSSYPDSWILCVISDETGVIRRDWYEVDKKNAVIKVKAPSADGRVWATFSGMRDFNQKVATVTLIPEASLRKMEVTASSFRDKISAGDKERWVFSFQVNGNLQKSIPAMAVMSNKALNAIAPFTWNYNIDKGGFYNRTRLSVTSAGQNMTSAQFSVMPKYVGIDMAMPQWMTYGYPLAGNSNNSFGLRIRGARSVAIPQMKGEGAEEEIVMQAAVRDEVYMSAANDMVAEKGSMGKKYMSPEPSADTGGSDAGSANEEKLRPVEMPLAFFMSALKSDNEGKVDVEFVVPNFNTTWAFQLFGYNSELLTAYTSLDAVASKPVMVQSNPPRYLRTGDVATVSALLFNNSDKEIEMQGEIEIFDPVSGQSIVSRHFGKEMTGPSKNREVSLEFIVPSNVGSLGMRAYALGDNFSDGEQTLIAVLPSSTPVVESEQFYIGAGESTFSQKLPKFKKDTNVTLKYCNNPIWECVLALPSISVPDSKNILSLTKALYADALSENLVERYPLIRAGLEKIFKVKAAGDSSVLRSNLEKDAQLKTVALQNTPWVNNAASESMRMADLYALINGTKASEDIKRLMADIKDLQNADGGWSWCPEMKSSLFMTESVLMRFSMLKRLGCVPAGSDDMLTKGIAYCDKEIYDNYIENKKEFSTTSMLRYFYIRDYFDNVKYTPGMASLKKEALRKIAEEWNRWSVYDKATAALVLYNDKKYRTTAHSILESLQQLASKSATKGWWYDNLESGFNGMGKVNTTARVLEAFVNIEPSSVAVDGLRQWLVLQKETENWGDDTSSVEAIYAILSSGTDWTDSSRMPVIKLGDRQLDLSDHEVLTGACTLTLPDVSGKLLSIEKTSAGPAWGGIVSQYILPIDKVKSASCDNLRIEKKLLVVENTPAGEVAHESAFRVGDKVRVVLTVTCEKDMDYVALTDERSACLEPVDQLSGYMNNDNIWCYREVRDTKTSFFIGFLPKGVSVISYDCHVDREGEYASGIASVQSQYSPLQTAHSAGGTITVK